jgi:hypothetical protein
MWMVDPETMCRNHLLGEHVECHMFAGTINRGKNIRGYLDKGLLEVHNLKSRHDELAGEMEKRGYHHGSPLEYKPGDKAGSIDAGRNAVELNKRCEQCRERNRLTGK